MAYGWDIQDWRGEPDLRDYKVWLLNAVHCVPPWTPLFHSVMFPQYPYAHQSSAYEPGSKGWNWRVYKGYGYITAILPREDEIAERERVFKEKMTLIIDDPWGYIDKLKAQMKSYHDRLIPMAVEHMEDGDLAAHLYECRDKMVWRMWKVHFLGWCGLVNVLSVFNEIYQELTGITPADITYAKLMSGFDNALFDINRGLADLATRAMNLKLDDNFKLPDEEVLPAMEQSAVGRKWLKAFHEFINIYGWRRARLMEICTPSYIEKPSLAVPEVRRMMAIGGVHAPDMQRERLVREREEAEKEILAKLPPEKKEWFGKLMRCAQAAHVFNEDHDWWCECISLSVFRRAFMESAKRLTKAGALEAPEAVYYLLFDHLILASISHDVLCIYPFSEATRNKKEWDSYARLVLGSDDLPRFLGDPSGIPALLGADTLLKVLTPQPIAKPPEEVAATLVGVAGAPGVVEGIARVIMSEVEWDKVQPGEILVTPSTSATWTPLFGIIKGVVTDVGGKLTHAAIVSREYAIPCVAGTMEGTAKIKTGNRIRVDGNLLRVYVLERK